MEIAQTLCNDCGGKLTAAELVPHGPRKILICGICSQRALKAAESGWRFAWQWESHSGADGLRLASRNPVPWKAPKVALLHVTPNGAVQVTHTTTGKRTILTLAGETDLLLVAWPGYNHQTLLVVDDRAAALEALT